MTSTKNIEQSKIYKYRLSSVKSSYAHKNKSYPHKYHKIVDNWGQNVDNSFVFGKNMC